MAGAVLALPRLRAHAAAIAPNDVLAASTVQVARLLREGKVSAVELVEKCYARIDAVNPKINAVVATCRERALAEADEADAALAKGKSKGPLHGVPFTVKDSFDTAGVVSTGGTLGRKDYVPGKDATVVARARAAGAILLGKTNTPEFTLGGGGRGTVNLVHGLTKNPYNVDYQPSGSSGGAGADRRCRRRVLRHRLRLRRLDSRPRVRERHRRHQADLGRVPRTGHIVGYGGPFDSFQETGPLARRVEDLALLMPMLVGPRRLGRGDGARAARRSRERRSASRCASRTTRRTAQVDPTPEIQELVKQCVALLQAISAARSPKTSRRR